MHAAHGSIDIAIRRLLLSLPVNLHQMEFYMTHLKHSCKYHRLYNVNVVYCIISKEKIKALYIYILEKRSLLLEDSLALS